MMRLTIPSAVLLAVLSCLLVARSVPAAETGEMEQLGPDEIEKIIVDRRIKQMKHPPDKRVQRYLKKAAEESDAGSPEEGQALLDKLRLNRLNPYDRAMIFRLKAFLHYGTGDYDGAIENFEKTLAEEVLPLEAENRIRFNVAQIHASLQQWPETIAALKRWFRYVQDPDPLAYYLLGIAYFQQDDLDSSLVYTRKAVEMTDEPREGWLQLLAALYVQKEDYASATPVFEELVARFPKKSYWVQLSLIYGARDDYRSSLAIQQIAYLQGFLTEEKEYLRLARSYLYHDLPLQAAQVIEEGIEKGIVEKNPDNYELLANSLIAAREYDRSLDPLQKAANLSKDGNLNVRLGQVHLQREEWDQAAEQLQRGISKGGLKHPGNAQLLLGISYYNDERVDLARGSFARAREYEDTREAANRWITHIESEAAKSNEGTTG